MSIEEFKSAIISLRENMLIVAMKMLQQEEDAEDVVQESLLRLWSNRSQLTKIDNPGGFAMQTVKNACIDKLRMQRTTVDVATLNLHLAETDPYVNLEQQDAVDLVKQIIKQLPELQRRIILMRDVDGYELHEIATITGTQITAVTMNLSRARKRVRDRFFKNERMKIMKNEDNEK